MHATDVEYHTALRYSSDRLAQILTHCFENYIVPFAMEGIAFASRFHAEDLSLNHSLVVTYHQRPVALALIARRGRHSRIAALSIRPEMRGQGLGKALMARLITDARARGDRQLSLEVIDGNHAALALYQQAGLAVSGTLRGFHAPLDAVPPPQPLQEIDPLLLSRRLIADNILSLPWLIAPETLYKLAGGSRAFTLHQQAFALVAPSAERCALRMVYVPQALRGKGYGRALLQALQHQYAPLPLMANVYVPECAAGFFTRIGWREEPLRQCEMTLTFGVP
ncbi:GNAT family N-acetyltransferase [Serratia odorifera]|uniref:GNAT family N-acetyltransferase n=1 Tax=Serratia odorifera TaxID=618 RepID=UPI003531F44F